MAGIYHGHVLEFPQIRIDCFTQPTDAKPHYIPYPLTVPDEESNHYSETGPSKQKGPDRSGVYRAPKAQYYLLTHAHTDHLSGLGNLHNNCTILCSENTKALLLNYERRKDRAVFDKAIEPILAEARRSDPDDAWVHRQIRASGIEQKKVYQGLRAKEVIVDGNPMLVDCVRTIPYNTVIPLTLSHSSGSSVVNFVMLDANHCPGSSMFLLWSPFPPYTSVLHTGDMRADDGFIQDLIRNPLVQPFLQSYPVKHSTGSGTIVKDQRLDATDFRPMFPGPNDHPGSSNARKPANGYSGLQRRLDRIYLDTSLFVGSCDMPSREEAIGNLIHLINGFPADTVFHLHCWTFGYEEVLKALARTYDTRIHLDRWQLQNHLLLHGDPLLQQLGTSDRSPLFHACEGDDGRGCEAVTNTRHRLVRVEFVEEHVVEHALKMSDIMDDMRLAQVGEASWPTKIYCPLARHVTLPELEVLISLFKPRSLSPNTLIPALLGCDYYMMKHVFKNIVADGGDNIRRECLDWFARERGKSEAEVEELLNAISVFANMTDASSGSEEDGSSDELPSPSPKVKTEDKPDRPVRATNSRQSDPLGRSRTAIRSQQVASYMSREERSALGQAGPSRAQWQDERELQTAYGASDEDTDVENERSRQSAMAAGRLKRKRRQTEASEDDFASETTAIPADKNRRIGHRGANSSEILPDKVKVEDQSDEERLVERRLARDSTARMALRYGG